MAEPISQTLPKPQPQAHIQPTPGREHPPRPLDPATKPMPKALLRQAPANRGKTSIADGVVEKIAGMAARDVRGIAATRQPTYQSRQLNQTATPHARPGSSATTHRNPAEGERHNRRRPQPRGPRPCATGPENRSPQPTHQRS